MPLLATSRTNIVILLLVAINTIQNVKLDETLLLLPFQQQQQQQFDNIDHNNTGTPISSSNNSIIVPNDKTKTKITGTNIKDKDESIHVMYGLSGNASGFFDEFETSLKSVLINAPIDNKLYIHLITDNDAYKIIQHILVKNAEMIPMPNNTTDATTNHNENTTITWKSRNQITIQIYNISQKKIKQYKKRIHNVLSYWPMKKILRHSIGNYFSLFSHEILSSDVHHAIALDTDVVIMANLVNLWKQIQSSNNTWFQWGKEGMCAGFLILNVSTLDKLWNYIQTINITNINELYDHKPGDQMIYRAINYTKPERVGILSKAWDVSIADEIWKYKDDITSKRPEVGMMHFNGESGQGLNSKNQQSAFKSHLFINKLKKQNTFSLAKYYLMPWTWVRFIVKSQVGVVNGNDDGGYPIMLKLRSL